MKSLEYFFKYIEGDLIYKYQIEREECNKFIVYLDNDERLSREVLQRIKAHSHMGLEFQEEFWGIYLMV